MSDIRGVHRTVSYRATFHERAGQTHWHAKFNQDGQASEARGSISNSWSPLPTAESRMHVTMQLYIEATLLRRDYELEPDLWPAK